MSSDPQNFSEARARLEEIVDQVRAKDVSLERSLDLFDEAIKLGNNCFELIDRVDFSQTEAAADEAADSPSASEAESTAPGDDEDTIVDDGMSEEDSEEGSQL